MEMENSDLTALDQYPWQPSAQGDAFIEYVHQNKD